MTVEVSGDRVKFPELVEKNIGRTLVAFGLFSVFFNTYCNIEG